MRINIKSLYLCVKDMERATFQAEVVSWRRGYGQKIPYVMSARLGNSIIKISFFGKVGGIYQSVFPEGTQVLISGEVHRTFASPTLTNPDIFKFDEFWIGLLSGYVPVYKRIKGVSHLFLLRTVKQLVDILNKADGDWLPSDLPGYPQLPDFIESVTNIHFPQIEINDKNLEELNSFQTPWHKKIAFDKLLFYQYKSISINSLFEIEKLRKIEINSTLSLDVQKNMPFELTDAQKRVLAEIRGDLALPRPMNRLLQGDVGSGKTAVLVLAGLDVIASGFKCVIMAPTEILATQHYSTIRKMVPPEIRIELFVGGVTSKKKKQKRLDNAEKADFIVGTHALFENLEFSEKIGLVIIDEQHRFGVAQRLKLQQKSTHPDFLVVSATPIPRTLALTLYGSTEISVIDEMPPGRIPVQTKYVTAENRYKVFDYVIDIVRNHGKKGYWVCPLVEEDDPENEPSKMKSVESVFEEFSKILGKKTGFLHGKMKGEEKTAIIEQLKNGEISLLVSTVVIEVGIDISDASFIVIENAERFGLAQLHQLRGRVGRGNIKSFCALIGGQEISMKAEERLAFMTTTENGFEVAEYDLKTRGPGLASGLDQSGFKNSEEFLLVLRYGEYIERARCIAKQIAASKESELNRFFDRVFSLLFQELFDRIGAS
ncbi:ATP-dependent DNA helicase RecG [bacterium]|nr:ATP-dependent DNA helicase RecG [bacterium]